MKEEILKEIKYLFSLRERVVELGDVEYKIEQIYGMDFFSSTLTFMGFFVVSGIVSGFLGLAVNGLFGYELPEYVYLILSLTFSLIGANVVYFKTKKEEKRLFELKDELLIKTNKDFNIKPDEETIEFKDFYNFNDNRIKEFQGSSEKIDFILNALIKDDDDFMDFSDFIIDLTKKVTNERKRRAEVRNEARSRMGFPFEKEADFSIVEE